jgi:hypothetical protein
MEDKSVGQLIQVDDRVMYRVYGHCYTLRVYLYEQCWCLGYRKTVLHCRNIYTNFSVPSGNFYSQPYFTHQYPI